jgi:hypothetical protein
MKPLFPFIVFPFRYSKNNWISRHSWYYPFLRGPKFISWGIGSFMGRGFQGYRSSFIGMAKGNSNIEENGKWIDGERS